MFKNPIFKMVFTLVVIAVVVAAAMGAVNQLTEPLIAENSEKSLKEALAVVLQADDYQLQEGIGTEETQVYAAIKDGVPNGICVLTTVTGYGGDVQVLTGVGQDNKVTGVKILSHSETPGLGANAEKEPFISQYRGKSGSLSVSKVEPKENEIQAISGATITSKAVTEAVNVALEIAQEYQR